MIVTITAVVLIGIVGVIFWNKSNEKVSEKETTTKRETETRNEFVTSDTGDLNLEEISPEVKKSDDSVEPGEDTLDIEKIQGFSEKKSNGAEKSDNKTNNNETETGKTISSQYVLSDERITIESVGAYSGNYIEDGSDEPIENVAAMIITNNSDQMLQVGDITFQVTKKAQASFRVTNLMPHTSVLVLELNRRKYKEKDDYSYGTVASAWLDEPDILEDKFEIKKENGKLTLVNKTDDTYDTVYVYYKYARSGGVYMGGITYRVPFKNVGAKKSVESVANHFNKNSSRIIDIQILEK